MEGYLAVMETIVTPGYQTLYWEIGTTAWAKLLSDAQGQTQQYFEYQLMKTCCYTPRPQPGEFEVADASPLPNKNGVVGLTIRVRRGHYQMAEFLRKHHKHNHRVATRVNEVLLYCTDCTEELALHILSFPQYDFTMLPKKEEE